MNLMTLKNGACSFFNVSKMFVKDHTPQILIGVAIGSEVGAIVSSCYAMTKMPDVLDEHKERIEELKKRSKTEGFATDMEYKKELTRVYLHTGCSMAKYWGPPAALTGLSITSGLAAYGIVNKKYVGAMASLTTMTEKFKSYRSNVIEDVGMERDKMYLNNDILKAKAIRILNKDTSSGEEKPYTKEEIEEARKIGAESSLKAGTKLIPTNHPYTFEWSIDTVNPNFFNENSHLYNVQFICNYMIAYWNNRLASEGVIELNPVLKSLGLDIDMSSEFDDIGWCDPKYDERCDGFIDFGFDKDGSLNSERQMWKNPTPELELMFKQNPDTDRVMLVMNCCDIREAKKKLYGNWFGKGGKLEAKLNGTHC